MAWNYFTTDLAPGEVITREQRNELYDALDERVRAALGPGAWGDPKWVDAGLDAMEAVRESPIITDLVRWTYDDSTNDQLARLHEVLDWIDGCYLGALDWETLFSPTTWRERVAADLAITTSALGAFLDSEVSSAARWNILRRGIITMRYVIVGEPAEGSLYEKAAEEQTFHDVAQAVVNASEEFVQSMSGWEAVTVAQRFDVDAYSGASAQTVASVDLPDILPYEAGYEVWVAEFDAGHQRSDTLRVYWGGGSGTKPSEESLAQIASAVVDVGSITVRTCLATFEDGAAGTWADYDLGAGAWATVHVTTVEFFLVPTFTHP